MHVHIFDVDYTIVRCSTVRTFIHGGLKSGLIGYSLGFYLPHLFLRYGLDRLPRNSIERAYPFLKDVAKADLEALARSTFTDRLLPKIDAAVAGRIMSVQGEGDRVIIASSSFRTILEPLTRHLGIEEVVASELEFREGYSTGRIEGEPAFGKGKRTKVLAYLSGKGIDTADCAFYTDSHRDLPLLREVGEPVAVNPGTRLRRIARGYGWQILDT